MYYKPKLPGNIDSLRWIGPDDAALQETGLIHCVYLPPETSNSQPAPLVVMIHGWGGDESVMWIFKRTIPPQAAIITPRAPLEVEENRFAWFQDGDDRLHPERDALDKAAETLHHFLQGVKNHYPVGPVQPILMGFSQGAMMCNAYVLRYPKEVLGVASLAGAMPALNKDELQAEGFAGLPVFIAHGNRDDTISIDAARSARQNYETLGASITYGEYNTSHKMNVKAMTDLEKWLTGLINNKE